MLKTKVIYPGTFDPITNGHIDLIMRANNLFDLTVAISKASKKDIFFSLEDRITMVKESLGKHPEINVIGFDGLLVNLANKIDARLVIRGLRAVSDFEYEFQLAGMNRQLDEKIETIFMTPSEQYANISSSLVRQIAFLGGNINKFVPKVVTNLFNNMK